MCDSDVYTGIHADDTTNWFPKMNFVVWSSISIPYSLWYKVSSVVQNVFFNSSYSGHRCCLSTVLRYPVGGKETVCQESDPLRTTLHVATSTPILPTMEATNRADPQQPHAHYLAIKDRQG